VPFVFGLDLGQAADRTALAGLELAEDRQSYCLRLLKRWHLKTPYPVMVDDVEKLLSHPTVAGCRLIIDQTGVGRPVVDLFRASGKLRIVPVTITAGQTAHEIPEERRWNVPKTDLVGAVIAALGTGALTVAEGLAEWPTLLKEIESFKMQITKAGAETFGAAGWREGAHDDLVLALALAVWSIRRIGSGLWAPETRAQSFETGRNAVRDAPSGTFGPRGDDSDDEPRGPDRPPRGVFLS